MNKYFVNLFTSMIFWGLMLISLVIAYLIKPFTNILSLGLLGFVFFGFFWCLYRTIVLYSTRWLK
jgi:hypothetical protein